MIELQNKFKELINNYIFNSYEYNKEITRTNGHILSDDNTERVAKECVILCLEEKIKGYKNILSWNKEMIIVDNKKGKYISLDDLVEKLQQQLKELKNGK